MHSHSKTASCRRKTRLLAVASLLAVSAVCATAAKGFDLHAFWDSRCKDCHGHAAAFAREHLSVVEGRLQGRHHATGLKHFLGQHEMGPEHVESIYAMLLAQAQTEPVYQQKCAGCHKTAAEFARAALVMKDGVLVGKSSGKPVAEFLKQHGRLTAEERPVVVEALTRVHGEVGGATR